MTLTFRPAREADAAAAQAAYRSIIDHLARTVDFPHWHTEGHPSPAKVAAWVEAGDLHLAVDDGGDIAGVVVLDHDAAEGYDAADWAVPARPEEVLVVHGLGVVPGHLGTGVAGFLLDGTIRLARERGLRAVRLDVYVENLPGRALYERHGFTDLGCHTVRYDGTELSEFHLFEHVL